MKGDIDMVADLDQEDCQASFKCGLCKEDKKEKSYELTINLETEAGDQITQLVYPKLCIKCHGFLNDLCKNNGVVFTKLLKDYIKKVEDENRSSGG